MKPIAGLLGFDFIKNKTLRGVARVVSTAAICIAATTPQGAAVLTALGISPDATGLALIAALGGVEGLRKIIKHK